MKRWRQRGVVGDGNFLENGGPKCGEARFGDAYPRVDGEGALSFIVLVEDLIDPASGLERVSVFQWEFQWPCESGESCGYESY